MPMMTRINHWKLNLEQIIFFIEYLILTNQFLNNFSFELYLKLCFSYVCADTLNKMTLRTITEEFFNASLNGQLRRFQNLNSLIRNKTLKKLKHKFTCYLMWVFHLKSAVKKKRIQNAGARTSAIQNSLTSPRLSRDCESPFLASKTHSESPASLMQFHQRRPTWNHKLYC